MSHGRVKGRSGWKFLDSNASLAHRASKEQWEEMMAEVSAARDKDAREFDPFRADEQASQAFIDSAALTPEQRSTKAVMGLFLAVAASLRKCGCKTSELCQELIKADVQENL